MVALWDAGQASKEFFFEKNQCHGTERFAMNNEYRLYIDLSIEDSYRAHSTNMKTLLWRVRSNDAELTYGTMMRSNYAEKVGAAIHNANDMPSVAQNDCIECKYMDHEYTNIFIMFHFLAALQKLCFPTKQRLVNRTDVIYERFARIHNKNKH